MPFAQLEAGVDLAERGLPLLHVARRQPHADDPVAVRIDRPRLERHAGLAKLQRLTETLAQLARGLGPESRVDAGPATAGAGT